MHLVLKKSEKINKKKEEQVIQYTQVNFIYKLYMTALKIELNFPLRSK